MKQAQWRKSENGKFANQWKTITMSFMKESKMAKAARAEAAEMREKVMAKEEVAKENQLLKSRSYA